MRIIPPRSVAILGILLASCQGLVTVPSSAPATSAPASVAPATGGLEVLGGAGTVKVDEDGTVTIKPSTVIPSETDVEDSGDTTGND